MPCAARAAQPRLVAGLGHKRAGGSYQKIKKVRRISHSFYYWADWRLSKVDKLSGGNLLPSEKGDGKSCICGMRLVSYS